jgi:hypothetical protein
MGPCIVIILYYISNKMQRYTVYFIWKLLYMFRVVPPQIIRSANNCIYSIWYLSHRYYYLPLSWKSWKRFECGVDGARNDSYKRMLPRSLPLLKSLEQTLLKFSVLCILVEKKKHVILSRNTSSPPLKWCIAHRNVLEECGKLVNTLLYKYIYIYICVCVCVCVCVCQKPLGITIYRWEDTRSPYNGY